MDTTMEREIDVGEIEPQRNDRTVFDPDELQGLADSIKEVGLIQAITVRPKPDGSGYHLIAGERRWRAMQLLGRPTIRAVVTDDADRLAGLKMLAENKARTDLNPIDEARAYKSRIDEHGDTIESISKAAGVPIPTIRWRLGLLELDPVIQTMIGNGQIRHTVGEAIVGLDVERQHAVLKLIGQKPLSLDEIWRVADKMRAEQEEQPLFDVSAFELHADELVEQVKAEAVELTPRQMAELLHDIVAAMTADDPDALDAAEQMEALIQRAKAVVEYRYGKMKKKVAWE